MSSPVSVFQGLAQDAAHSAGRARAIDRGPQSTSTGVRYAKTGDVLYTSRLGVAGFDGWRPVHFDYMSPTPPIGLTNHPLDSDTDTMALNLSTGERTYTANNRDNQCVTFRSVSLYTSKRFLKYSAKVALSDGGFNLSWDSWGLIFDIQARDDSWRSLPRFICRAEPAPDFTKWYIEADDGTRIYVPGSNHLSPGTNENKMGYGYVSVVWDRAAHGGIGGYHEMQIQDQVFDLTGLGGGSATEPPQIAGDPIDEYNNSLNIGLFVTRSTAASQVDIYPAGIRACSIVLTAHDLQAA